MARKNWNSQKNGKQHGGKGETMNDEPGRKKVGAAQLKSQSQWEEPLQCGTGVITKAWTWLLTWGGIPHQRKQKLIKNIRNELKEYANTTWKYRCQANEKARIEDKIPDAKYSKQLIG